MATWNDTQKREVEFEKAVVLQPGDVLQVTVNGVALLDAIVPAGKRVRGWVCVKGEVENAT